MEKGTVVFCVVGGLPVAEVPGHSPRPVSNWSLSPPPRDKGRTDGDQISADTNATLDDGDGLNEFFDGDPSAEADHELQGTDGQYAADIEDAFELQRSGRMNNQRHYIWTAICDILKGREAATVDEIL